MARIEKTEIVDRERIARPPPARTRFAVVALVVVALVVVVVAGVVVALARGPGAVARRGDGGVAHESSAPFDAGATIVEAATDAGAQQAGTPATPEGGDDVDEVPLVPVGAERKTKRVVVAAPASVRWRGTRVRGGGVVDAPVNAKTLVAVDDGVHEVPIVDGKADFAKLPTGTLPVWLPPAGGEVFLNGKSLGRAPIKPLVLVVGSYKLRAVDAAKQQTATVTVRPGTNPPLRLLR
jgi:hypothetical protein